MIVQRVLVPSLDGTAKIPLEITYLPRARRDGVAPTVLTAYGAYGTITSPHFLGSWLAWLERGGVYCASDGPRRRRVYGEDWHDAARLATKTLQLTTTWRRARSGSVRTGFGDARHLGIEGGSAGGYLMEVGADAESGGATVPSSPRSVSTTCCAKSGRRTAPSTRPEFETGA